MKALIWSGEELGATFDTVDIPEDMLKEAEEYRHELVDRVSRYDDIILEKYLGDEDITTADLKRGIRHATIHEGLVPILTGSAFKNKGVQPLLDAVVDFLPAPTELPPVKGMSLKGNEELERAPSPEEPFAALAFKIVADPHGKLTYFRVYSGTMPKGGSVLNARTGQKERVGRLLLMHANMREDLDVVTAGDIVAGIGLKNTTDRRHAVRREGAHHPRGARVPRTGDPRCRRAEDQERPGQDGQGPVLTVRRGPDVPGSYR